MGGGAAGLAAAVFAARSCGSLSVAVLEKAPRVGKRLLATGNGTCNISNSNANGAHYHGTSPEFALPALKSFPPSAACEFFSSIGVECITRSDGRVYPICLQAGAVLDCLRIECAALGVYEIADTQLTEIAASPSGFILHTTNPDRQKIAARRVIFCPGGMAAPRLGGSADAYSPLTALGHTKTPLFPSIVQIATDTTFIKSIKGLRADACVSIFSGTKQLDSCTDEILFTDYGISGPGAMRVSRCVSERVRRPCRDILIRLELLPDISAKQLADMLLHRVSMPGRSTGDMLTGLLNKRIGQTLLRAAGYRLDIPVQSLTQDDLKRICGFIKAWDIPVTGVRGWNDAQVTAGGLRTSEFDSQTLESHIVPGLFAAGEVLDIDGDCGGFNLQWAWASAHLAASSAVRMG